MYPSPTKQKPLPRRALRDCGSRNWKRIQSGHEAGWNEMCVVMICQQCFTRTDLTSALQYYQNRTLFSLLQSPCSPPHHHLPLTTPPTWATPRTRNSSGLYLTDLTSNLNYMATSSGFAQPIVPDVNSKLRKQSRCNYPLANYQASCKFSRISEVAFSSWIFSHAHAYWLSMSRHLGGEIANLSNFENRPYHRNTEFSSSWWEGIEKKNGSYREKYLKR